MYIDAGRRLDSLGAVLHSNRAMVLGQQGEGARGEALRAALASISADPSYAKGHHRVGSALQVLPPTPSLPPSLPPLSPSLPRSLPLSLLRSLALYLGQDGGQYTRWRDGMM